MPEIQEEELVFQFPEHWQVEKYDAWSFYRNQFQKCCGSCKAVDFVAVCSSRREFWLVEVKDYRQHRRTKPIDLAEEIACKVRDSLAGVAAARFRANADGEKHFARTALQGRTIRVALHLEQPRTHSKLFPRAIDPANVLQKLKSLIKPIDPHPLIVERGDCDTRAGWQVRSAGD